MALIWTTNCRRSHPRRCRLATGGVAALLFITLICTFFADIRGSVINDVNKMLRDATTTETEMDAVLAIRNDESRASEVMSNQILRNSDKYANLKKERKIELSLSENRRENSIKNKENEFNHNKNSVSDDNDGNDEDDSIADGDSENSVEMKNVGETSVELLRFVNDEDENHQNAVLTTASTIVNGKDSYDSGSDSAAQNDVAASDVDVDVDANMMGDTLSLEDQVRLLTKQLNALMTRRREDYEILEHNLRKTLRITTNAESADLDVRDELKQLRLEVKTLRDNQHGKSNNKERLTIEWLQQSVAELRKQLSELQQMANTATRDIRQRRESYEDLATIRNDFQQLKLELISLRESQGKNEVYVRELREELLQQEEDFRRMLHNLRVKRESCDNEDDASDEKKVEGKENDNKTQNENENALSNESTADHRRRHCRFQRQQIHELQLSQRRMKHQVDGLKFHRIDERVRNIELEQHRIADANFNLSRQIASLDKLHSSMLELLEDVEGLQNKMDKNIPELRHEISKLEFSNAQLSSEQNLVREEGKNVARSVQAMAVSISTLQDERGGVKQMQNTLSQLQANVDRLGSMMQDVQRALTHQHKRPENKPQHGNGKIIQAQHSIQQHQGHHHHSSKYNANKNNNNIYNTNNIDNTNIDDGNGNEVTNEHGYTPMTQRAESLVAKLENVEQQYESIINKLPQDCSEVVPSNDGNGNGDGNGDGNGSGSGLYMIAPAGQHRPLMAHCNADGWTTVQRRFDGSADFNRSWEDYAIGFGVPMGEYWIGNEQLHHLTVSNCTALRVIMQDIYDNTWLAEYSNFYISSRADGYRLHVSGYHGNASDALDYQQGMQFSAIDVDRDISQTHCAANYEGGWWFSHCQHANLNGRYNLGLTWFDASRNEWIAVKSSQMLIKRHQTSESCRSILDRSSVSSSATSATTIFSSNAASILQNPQISQTTLPVTTLTNSSV